MRKKGSTEKESREKRKGENIKEKKKKLRKERESGKRMWERGNEDEEKG